MANTPNPGTGAGGLTGPPGAPQPTSPVSTIPTSGQVKAKPWQHTKDGANAADAYSALHTAFWKTLPSQREQFLTLSRRPIGG